MKSQTTAENEQGNWIVKDQIQNQYSTVNELVNKFDGKNQWEMTCWQIIKTVSLKRANKKTKHLKYTRKISIEVEKSWSNHG